MKKAIRTIIVALMLGTFSSYATVENNKTSTFTYIKKGNYIAVSDASGEVLYSGKINNNGNLTTIYDFSQLDNGKYKVEVTKDFEIEIITVDVVDHTVTVLSSGKKTIHKPVVRNENAMVLISKLALNTDKMTVELYFEDELIHKETVEGGNILNRAYKLDKTLPGDYKAVIKSDDRVFVEKFRI